MKTTNSPEKMDHLPNQHGSGSHHQALPGYAQASQDLFALWVCGPDSTFLEIGAYHPCCLSNTLLLEQYGWTGESLELDPAHADMWEHVRRSPLVIGNALDGLTERVDRLKPDYISLDIDDDNMPALAAIMAASHRARCMTIETNEYIDGGTEGELIAAAMAEAGYVPIARRVKACDVVFESWWIIAPYCGRTLADDTNHELLAEAMILDGLGLILTATR